MLKTWLIATVGPRATPNRFHSTVKGVQDLSLRLCDAKHDVEDACQK